MAADGQNQSSWVIGVGDEEEVFGIGGECKCRLWLGKCGRSFGGFREYVKVYSSVPASRSNVGLVIEGVSYDLDDILLVVVTDGQGLVNDVVIEEEPAGHAGC